MRLGWCFGVRRIFRQIFQSGIVDLAAPGPGPASLPVGPRGSEPRRRRRAGAREWECPETDVEGPLVWAVNSRRKVWAVAKNLPCEREDVASKWI